MFSRILNCFICDWEYKISSLIGVNTSFALSLRAWSSDASISSNSSISAINVSLFQIPSADKTYPKINLPRLLDSLDSSLAEIKWYSTTAPDGDNWSVKWHAFQMVPSHQTRDLECFEDGSDTPWNPPTILCPDLTAMAPQMYFLSLCVLLLQQSHLFLICVGVDVQ